MKDSVIALVEAVRLARLELQCFRDPRCAASPEWTIKRLEELLIDPQVGEALLVHGEFVITLRLVSGIDRGNGAAKRSDQGQHGRAAVRQIVLLECCH